MKAEFANPQNARMLMPGQFVRVHLVGATFKNAILIPSSAVLHTAKELLVYVVDANNAVEARPIEADLQNDMYIVTKGLKAGDVVISEGLSRIRPGQTVQVQLQEFSAPTSHTDAAPQADASSTAQLEEALSGDDSADEGSSKTAQPAAK